MEFLILAVGLVKYTLLSITDIATSHGILVHDANYLSLFSFFKSKLPQLPFGFWCVCNNFLTWNAGIEL